eukprot:TRINITY_DN8095_c0_g1_i1.p1 TRINITY_DN8095_c0_g1~~TRINITY_DN8095_c0_g1_i1.p1  ORF type:complete len:55 (+),score=1.18 TRINITY_DN8095_c0_g1_i1:39-203(+)
MTESCFQPAMSIGNHRVQTKKYLVSIIMILFLSCAKLPKLPKLKNVNHQCNFKI